MNAATIPDDDTLHALAPSHATDAVRAPLEHRQHRQRRHQIG